MNSDTWRLVGLCIAVAAVILTSRIATRKGYPRGPWMLAAAVFWPVAVPWLLLMPNRKTRRKCLDCHSYIPYDAPVCRHCGRDDRIAQTAPHS